MERIFGGHYVITKSFRARLQLTKVYRGIFRYSLNFCIWHCHIFNDSAMLPYSSKGEDHHGIALLRGNNLKFL